MLLSESKKERYLKIKGNGSDNKTNYENKKERYLKNKGNGSKKTNYILNHHYHWFKMTPRKFRKVQIHLLVAREVLKLLIKAT